MSLGDAGEGSAMGWRVPVSLLASMMETRRVLGRKGGLQGGGFDKAGGGAGGDKVTSTPRFEEGLGGVEDGVVLDGAR